MKSLVATLVCAALASCAQLPVVADSSPLASAACTPNPFAKRDLYLRGSFKNWNAADPFRFNYVCNQFELVAAIDGDHTFKVADDDWSRDADFGASPTTTPLRGSWNLALRGAGMQYNFRGNHRFIMTMNSSIPTATPTLTVTDCPTPPLGDTTLFLRGGMNNWGAGNSFAFQYSCDAYYLNTRLTGMNEFKIADAGFTNATTFGSASANGEVFGNTATALASATAAGVANTMRHLFVGEQTMRVAFEDGKPMLTIGPKSFVDPSVQTVSDATANSIKFDSRALTHKTPFGSVTTGSTIDINVSAAAGVAQMTLVVEKRRLEGDQKVLEYTELARVPMTKSARSDGEQWRARHTFAEPAIYGYYFEAEIGGAKFAYQNNRDLIPFTREEGSNGLGMVTDMPSSNKRIRRFRQTVYAADFKVPDWAADVVYYYIFPERFRNGNAANDPKPGVDKYQNKGVEFHRNWLEKPFRPNTGDGSDDVYNNDFFGGDLAGIIEKLGYIAELGANTIYMTPIFTAASNHKYDTADYKNIDPHFGTNADFTKLTEMAAQRGLRVIVDASLNHVGSDSIYFDRYNNFGGKGAFAGSKVRRDSPYASWFTFDESQPDPNKQYTGWVGVTDLPELNKASVDYRKFAIGDADSVTRLWLDRGAAGWRMDVAPFVPDDFWREWRKAVKQQRPDTLTVAETWWDSSKFFLGDTFDSTMNYIFRDVALEYAKGGDAAKLYRSIEFTREAYPPQAFFALMNLVGSHDRGRPLFYLGYVDETTPPEKIADAKQRFRLTAFLQMILPGSPTIYYGDEVGVTGGEDPYNRATYPWADKGGAPDMALHADFKRLTAMRKTHPVLRRGTLSAPLFADANVIVVARELNGTLAIAATNNASNAKTVTVTLPSAASKFTDALTGAVVNSSGGQITFSIPPMFGTVLIAN